MELQCKYNDTQSIGVAFHEIIIALCVCFSRPTKKGNKHKSFSLFGGFFRFLLVLTKQGYFLLLSNTAAAVTIKLIYDIQAGWIHMDTHTIHIPISSIITYLHSTSNFPDDLTFLLRNVFQFSIRRHLATIKNVESCISHLETYGLLVW